ncbi:zinc finger, CCHC-type containing protein [Tanacetum coccineum]|uniref:Zinc finger, CCHC-type containing protein n=1 Tax=Tanacetum coccineum TaxID=301880 RepID=A0ABQ5DUQ5_9ASTR
MSKDGLILVLTWTLKNVKLETDDLGADLYLLYNKDETLDKLKVFKIEFELQQGSLIKRFRTDKGGEYMDTLYFQSVGIIHEMTAPYTPQQNGISKRKNRVLKEMVNSMLSYSGLSQGAVVRLLDPKLKTLGERGIECIFVGYAEHSKAFRFYVIEPNDSVAINLIIKLKDAIFDENRFSSVPRPSLSIPKGTKDIGGSVVPEVVTDEVVQQPESELRKSKRNRTPKDFGPEFQLYLIEGTRDEGFKQKSRRDYFDTYTPVARISTIRLLIAMASIHNQTIHQMDVKTAFLNGDLDEEVYMNQPQGFIMPGNENKGSDKCRYNKFDESGKRVIICLYVDDMLIFGTDQVQVDLTKEFLSSRFSMKDMGETDVILVLGGYIDGSRISNIEENSSTSGWVFLLDGGAISWASKKQIYITGSIIESEFVALAAAGKEAEWLKNLLLEIPLWSKPIAPISIRCDSAATLAKAYSQMYNGKSRHLGVRHSMIRELITNGVISIEFVMSQQNLADHLTKGLARDLVIKSAEGMGLNGLKHMYLHIIPRMCLEPADKEDEVVNFLMVNFFEKVLSRSMNKEEPPMYSNGLKDGSDSDDSYDENESRSLNENEEKNEVLDDFIEQVVEEKVDENPINEVHQEEEELIGMESHSTSGGKPPGFETKNMHETVFKPKDKSDNKGDSDATIPPDFEDLFKNGKDSEYSGSSARVNKCSTFFGNFKSNERKGFSFIVEMNKMIEQIVESRKELWDSLKAKYMAKDASSKKFVVSNFTNYKMTDSRPVLEQYNELLGILRRFTQHKMNMDKSIQVSCIIDKLLPSWKDFKHTLKHLKEELTLVELDSNLRIEESLKIPCDSNVIPLLGNKKYFVTFIDDASRAVVRLLDPKLKTLSERGIECIFVGYAEHSKAFRFYVIKPNDSVAINSIIESMDAIFDENRFSSVPRPSLSIPKGTEDIGGSVFPEVDDPKTFDEAIKSHDVAFCKEAINEEMNSTMGNNTWVLADPGCWSKHGKQNSELITHCWIEPKPNNSYDENESRSLNEKEEKNEVLDDFIEQVVEEKVDENLINEVHQEEEELIGMESHSTSGGKPPGLETKICMKPVQAKRKRVNKGDSLLPFLLVLRFIQNGKDSEFQCGDVLTNPILEDSGDDPTVKELWDSLKAKYMAKDASSKKFVVSNFTNYKMTDSRPVSEQYNELLGILRRFTQHKMNMDESIQVSCIIDKLLPSWKDFKHTLKHLKEELTLVELDSNLRIEESLKVFLWSLIKRFRTDKGGEYMDTLYFQSVVLIHETTAVSTAQQTGISERKIEYEEMVNLPVVILGLSQGFSGGAMERLSHKKTKSQAKSNKTSHGMEKCVKAKPNPNVKVILRDEKA